MRQHSLVARLGTSDTGPVQTHTPDGLTTEIRFIDGHRRLGFGLGQFTDGLAARAVVPSEAAIDLCILAACITAADTRISRADDSQDSWTREIDIHVPASDVDLWTSVGERIGQALGFLTGDRWRLFFRSRHKRLPGTSEVASDEDPSELFGRVLVFWGSRQLHRCD